MHMVETSIPLSDPQLPFYVVHLIEAKQGTVRTWVSRGPSREEAAREYKEDATAAIADLAIRGKLDGEYWVDVTGPHLPTDASRFEFKDTPH